MGKLAILLGVPVAMLATVASMGVVVVDVREGGPDGHRVVVPVPLVLAQAALTVAPVFAPADKLRVPAGEGLEHIALAREVLEALAAAPDGELVSVEGPNEQVLIAKQGRNLKVRVHQDHGEGVSVNVPLQLALQALPDAKGHLRLAGLAGALGGVRFTDLVEVKGEHENVRIWVW
jgi:hypothetical protein